VVDGQTDRRTDGQTDGETEFSSQYRVCITCSTVKKLCKSVEDLLFMQFRRQGTKVFIKLELKKIHIFILQYS